MATVSIIIRTRNEAAWIRRTLEAVFTQDFRDFEVILVDSGSEDQTLAIAGEFDTRVLRIPAEAFTYGHALNVGAEVATGRYLVALSAHAVPADRRWLSELLRPLADPQVAGASSRQVPHPGHRLESYLVFWQAVYRLRLRGRLVHRYLFSNASSAVRAVLWREEPFDEHLASCEDHFWARRMQRRGFRIAYCPTSVVLHSHKMPLGARLRRNWRELKALVRGYPQARAAERPPAGRRPTGGLRPSFQALRLLLRCVNPWPGAAVPAARRRTDRGAEYDLYEPAGAARKTFILVYGLDLAGEHDARLVRFGRAFVRSGFRVAIPVLPGLKSCAFDPGDRQALADLVACLHREHGGRIGIAAFSAGAGLALTAAAGPEVADLLDPLLLFSPYYDLAELWRAFGAQRAPVTGRKKDWDVYIWTQLVLAYRRLDTLDLGDAEKRELVKLLEDYCTERSLRRKREFHDRVLKGLDLGGATDVPPDGGALEGLSPRGRLERVAGRVLILHDSTDRLVPPEHADRIVAELRRRGRPHAQKLVVTPLLSHVSPGWTWRILDGFRILGLFKELFTGNE